MILLIVFIKLKLFNGSVYTAILILWDCVNYFPATFYQNIKLLFLRKFRNIESDFTFPGTLILRAILPDHNWKEFVLSLPEILLN
jgi:hypothetical protein